MCTQFLCFSLLDCLFLCYDFYDFSIYFVFICKYFFPFCTLPFHCDDCFFCCAETFCSMKSYVFIFISQHVFLVLYPKTVTKTNVKGLFPLFSSFYFMNLSWGGDSKIMNRSTFSRCFFFIDSVQYPSFNVSL